MAALLFAGVAAVPASADDWCDIDPIVVVTTPSGNLVPLYYMTGAEGVVNTVTLQLSKVQTSAARAADGVNTAVTLTVTVPKDALGTTYNTRVLVSNGVWGTGTVYGSATGTSGSAMQVKFQLNVP